MGQFPQAAAAPLAHRSGSYPNRTSAPESGVVASPSGPVHDHWHERKAQTLHLGNTQSEYSVVKNSSERSNAVEPDHRRSVHMRATPAARDGDAGLSVEFRPQ